MTELHSDFSVHVKKTPAEERAAWKEYNELEICKKIPDSKIFAELRTPELRAAVADACDHCVDIEKLHILEIELERGHYADSARRVRMKRESVQRARRIFGPIARLMIDSLVDEDREALAANARAAAEAENAQLTDRDAPRIIFP